MIAVPGFPLYLALNRARMPRQSLARVVARASLKVIEIARARFFLVKQHLSGFENLTGVQPQPAKNKEIIILGILPIQLYTKPRQKTMLHD
jgi:hypothetical protein